MYPIQDAVQQDDGLETRRVPELILRDRRAPSPSASVAVSRQSRTCRIALVGFGTVGKSLARLLDVRRGEHRLELTHVCNRNVARKKLDWLAPDVVWTDNIDQVLASDVDVVVELMGGLHPAYDLVRGALQSGMSVVTANKQLLAHHGSELQRLATDRGQYLGFGACVAGGVPVLAGLRDGLAGDRITRIRGILNGTCNYILSRIDQDGVSFGEALDEAQKAGFAEADPSFDIDGQDAAAKLAILAAVGLKTAISPDQVLCRTIRDVSAIDFVYARELDCTIRQISTAILRQGEIYVAVQPSLVSKRSALAKISGSQNLIASTGEFGGETTFGGVGAGGNPTAVAILSDLFHAAACRSRQLAIPDHFPASEPGKKLEVLSPFYVRFVVQDQVGIIKALAEAFARHDLNIDAILQKPGYSKSRLPFVVTIEPCTHNQLDNALREIERFDFLVEAPVSMPIVEQEPNHAPAMQ